MVIGRYLFDMTNGWEGTPPAGEHMVVVSHRPKPDGWHPEASYHCVDDVAAAITKAKELAGERTVAVAAGEVGGQALALGLVDEVAMDVVPVVFGSGKRYFGPLDGQHLLEDPDVVIRGTGCCTCATGSAAERPRRRARSTGTIRARCQAGRLTRACTSGPCWWSRAPRRILRCSGKHVVARLAGVPILRRRC